MDKKGHTDYENISQVKKDAIKAIEHLTDEQCRVIIEILRAKRSEKNGK